MYRESRFKMETSVTLSPRFSMKFMRLLLLSNLIWQNPKYRIASIIATNAILFVAFIMFFGCVVGLMNLNDSSDSASLIFYMTIILQNIGTFGTMKYHRTELILYATKLQASSITNFKTNRFFKVLMKKFLIWFYVCYLTLNCVFLISFATNRDYGNNQKYIAPFWFSCSKANTSTFISRICWRTDTAAEYFISNIINFLFAFVLHIPYIMSISFFLLIMQFKKAHMLSILKEIENISSMANVSLQNNGDRTLCEELKKVIYQYQWLHNTLTDSLPILGRIVGFHLVGSYCNFLSAAFIVLHYLQDHSIKLIFGSAFLFLVPNFVFFCFAGQSINDLNTRISAAVYELPWYQQTIKFKKLIYQFMLLLQKPIQIKTFSMYHVRVNLLMHLSQRLYAAVSLMVARLK